MYIVLFRVKVKCWVFFTALKTTSWRPIHYCRLTQLVLLWGGHLGKVRDSFWVVCMQKWFGAHPSVELWPLPTLQHVFVLHFRDVIRRQASEGHKLIETAAKSEYINLQSGNNICIVIFCELWNVKESTTEVCTSLLYVFHICQRELQSRTEVILNA